jgi:radical SAM superfamily enzyme YgiQ (UPF0313 family)
MADKFLSMAASAYQISAEGACGAAPTSGLPIRKIPRKKINCILPSSPWLADSKTNVPLGVLYIAGLLRADGHDVVVTSMLDKRYEGNIHLPDHVMDADVHMFGFCTPQFGEALELAAYIKDRRPEALLVAGGPHPSYEPKEVKEAGRQDSYHVKGPLRQRRDYRAQDGRQLFDTVIVMEGEVATLQMLSDWDAGKLQPYYYGDKADAMDLDAIPFPAWDLLPHDHIYNDGVAVMKKKYFPNAAHPDASGAVMSLIGTRGCPYKCFVAGTLVDMADGTQKAVDSLSVGDVVRSFDAAGNLVDSPVTRTGVKYSDDVWRLTLEDGTAFEATGDHPFVTPSGWREVKDLQSGGYVRRVREAKEGQPQDVLEALRARGDQSVETRRQKSGEAAGRKGENFRDSQSAGAGISGENIVPTQGRRDPVRSDVYCVPEGSVGSYGCGQSDASSWRWRAALSLVKEGLQGRSALAACARSVIEAGARLVRLAGRLWTSGDALRRPNLLDWAVRVRNETQSGYQAYLEAAGHPVLRPVLAYAGGTGRATRGLPERGLVSTGVLGGMPARADYGPCPGARLPGDWVRIESVAFVGSRSVYPVSVADTQTFIVSGIAVHNCTYCSTPWIGLKPRYRSPKNIIAEMRQVMDKGVRMFKFQDDTYTLHRTKLRELAVAIDAELGRDSFAARIHTRVNTMDDHVAESLKLMNTKVTCFGIESGAQAVLNANQKGTTVAQNTAALINAKNHGFYTIAFLVIGMAGETVETMRETQKWLLSVKPYLDSCNLAVGIPYPGSRWWTHPQESGIDIVDYNYDNQWIVGFSARNEILVRPHGCTVEEMFKVKKEMFDFLVYHGWAKAEWDEDVRIGRQQEQAVKDGALKEATAASVLTYAGH